jgi:arabinose-5-phosphate isomerase
VIVRCDYHLTSPSVSNQHAAAPYTPPDELLRIEANAVLEAADRLDLEAFRKAVDIVAQCTGKTVLTGAGTSGLIAGKIAATLTSTGTPAAFLHPSDALHGGLGSVSEREVVIAISNSGETGEILALLPYLRNRAVPLVAIVGNLRSTLAGASDVALDATAEREACPFNLAPTSSTTVALAIGDALAVTLLQVKGLTPEAFALNHPSGRLGRRLTLRVVDLMHGGERRPAIGPGASWLEVIQAISDGTLGAVAVVQDGERLIGIVTDGDVRRAIQRTAPENLTAMTAATIMTPDPVTVGPQVLAYDALQRMEDRPSQIPVLPVVDDDGVCVGLLRVHDIVRAGV